MESREVPVKPHPVEAEWVRYNDGTPACRNRAHPLRRTSHRLNRRRPAMNQRVSIERVDREGFGLEPLADRAELDVNRVLELAVAIESLAVERPA